MSSPDQPPQISQEAPTCPNDVRDYMRETTEGFLRDLPDSQREPVLNASCIVEAACRIGLLRDVMGHATFARRAQEEVRDNFPSPTSCHELRALSSEIGHPICMLQFGLKEKDLL